ncbi:MAG: response regulator [Gammaproteobacteria bacterium]|nr:response regulator [Gammaproteobacteria bacterium]
MRILFVDDEPNVLSGLRRMLRSKRGEWEMKFFDKGADALQSLSEESCDVVVSDMRMPGMDGVKVLSAVKEKHPDSIRIALSGQTDAHMIYRCVEHAHQFLSKPCDVDTLAATVQRAFALRELLQDEGLSRLVSNLTSLPSMPEQYQLIMNELQTEDASLQKVGAIIESDVAMTAKILQLVNSAFFGLTKHVSSPAQAAMFLGVDVLKSLVLSTGVFTQFDEELLRTLNLGSIWPNSVRMGAIAKSITLEASDDKMLADYAYMGGMLADIGKVVLACNKPELLIAAHEAAQANGLTDWEAEVETIGQSHMAVGAYLVGLWGLPNPIVEAVAFHHRPIDCPGSQFSAVTAVHVASALVYANGTGELSELDTEYIETLGLTDKLQGWRELSEEQGDE